jgi:Fe-Mn family superoxide dismutase
MSAHGWLVVLRLLGEQAHQQPGAVGAPRGPLRERHAIAAVDAWEHAYFFDYQTAKAKYVESILSGLDWNVVGARLSAAGY